MFRVDDDAQALDEVTRSVVTKQVLPKLMRGIVRHRGCDLTEPGEIMTPNVKLEELGAALILVANASNAVAEHLVSTVRPPRNDMRRVVEEMLDVKFKDRWRRDGKIAAASNKEHGFDYLGNIPGGRQLALDFAVPDPSSVNSAVVAQMDVGQKKHPVLVQRIVHDDTQPWRSNDFQLLKVGARPVARSALRQSLERLSA